MSLPKVAVPIFILYDEQGTDLPGKTDDQVKESNLAAFVSYGLRLNKLELNAGLRYEHVSSNYYNLVVIIGARKIRIISCLIRVVSTTISFRMCP